PHRTGPPSSVIPGNYAGITETTKRYVRQWTLSITFVLQADHARSGSFNAAYEPWRGDDQQFGGPPLRPVPRRPALCQAPSGSLGGPGPLRAVATTLNLL